MNYTETAKKLLLNHVCETCNYFHLFSDTCNYAVNSYNNPLPKERTCDNWIMKPKDDVLTASEIDSLLKAISSGVENQEE